MKRSSVDPLGYVIAPLVAPVGYLFTVSVWFVFQFGFDGELLLRWYWQFVFFWLLAPASLVISAPALWLLNSLTQYVLLPKHLFAALVIALTFLFSWLVSSYLAAASSMLFFSSVVSGIALNYLVFCQCFSGPLNSKRSASK